MVGFRFLLDLPTSLLSIPELEVSRRRGTHRRGALIGVKTHGNGKAKLSLGNGQGVSRGLRKIKYGFSRGNYGKKYI